MLITLGKGERGRGGGGKRGMPKKLQRAGRRGFDATSLMMGPKRDRRCFRYLRRFHRRPKHSIVHRSASTKLRR